MSAWQESWHELLTTAALGTERGGALPALPTVVEETVTADGSTEEKLLDAIAVLSTGLRAGLQPSDGEPVERCEEDELPECSEKAGRLMEAALERANPRLMAEWCRLCAEAGQRAPTRLLPDLLDHSHHLPGEWSAAILGRRGAWLASKNPAWRVRAEVDDDLASQFLESPRALRLQALHALRRQDPARARELIAETWKGEKLDDRLRFLTSLAEGLSADDEPFLTERLAERSKKLRLEAAGLLSCLPGSPLARRMSERIGTLVDVERKVVRKKLTVELPELTDADEQDGLDDKAVLGLGRRASLLMRIVSHVPVAAWEGLVEKPDELLKLFAKSDHAMALVFGLAEAAVRQRRSDWAEAVLTHELGSQGGALAERRVELIGGLWRLVDRERREAMLLRLLDRARTWPEVGPVLQAADDELGMKAGEKLIDWCHRCQRAQWHPRLGDFIRLELPTILSPALAGRVHELGASREPWPAVAAVLELRRDMREELTP
ncbi:MAG: DUF5691 domain-containing protein [Acidobacteriota bacterium]